MLVLIMMFESRSFCYGSVLRMHGDHEHYHHDESAGPRWGHIYDITSILASIHVQHTAVASILPEHSHL